MGRSDYHALHECTRISGEIQAGSKPGLASLFPFVPTKNIAPDLLHMHLILCERVLHIVCLCLLECAPSSVSSEKARSTFLTEQMGAALAKFSGLRETEISQDQGATWGMHPKIDGARWRRLMSHINDVLDAIPCLTETPIGAKLLPGLKAFASGFHDLYCRLNKPFPFKRDAEVEMWRKDAHVR